MAFDLFKLEKLKISAFDNVDREGTAVLEVTVMFNPASYTRVYSTEWGRQQGINASGAQLEYSKSPPEQLSLDLVLDGTGVDQMGVLAIGQKTVSERVDELREVTYKYNGSIHEPNYLLVTWGKLAFPCRLASLTVNYTRFDRDGTPLRADVKLALLADFSAKTRAREEEKTSPDLTHARVVRAGDTLPLLTKAIYGSPARYLDVARHNELDDFRSLVPGQQLLFPPLAVLDAARGGRK